jgi:hypothetical protein
LLQILPFCHFASEDFLLLIFPFCLQATKFTKFFAFSTKNNHVFSFLLNIFSDVLNSFAYIYCFRFASNFNILPRCELSEKNYILHASKKISLRFASKQNCRTILSCLLRFPLAVTGVWFLTNQRKCE